MVDRVVTAHVNLGAAVKNAFPDWSSIVTTTLLTIYLMAAGVMAPLQEATVEPPPAVAAPARENPALSTAEIVAEPESSTPAADASAPTPGDPAPSASESAAAAPGNLASPSAGAAGDPSASGNPQGTPPPMLPERAGPESPAPRDGVSAGMSAVKLLGVDVREVLLSPAHWQARDWALFTAEVAAVVGVGAVDESLQRDATQRPSKSSRKLANDVRVFGAVGSAGALGGLFLTGLIAHDKGAEATALDGLLASGISAGLISGFLKVISGRSRPDAQQGARDFHPFRIRDSNFSFPAGEATEVFTLAAVISTHYPHGWVESDSLVGALIGYHVGRAVVHINERLRGHLAFSPLLGRGGERGLSVTAGF